MTTRELVLVQVGQCYFNVKTLRREAGLVEICRAFRSDLFIGLQSTSARTELEEDSPVCTTREDKSRVYRFPWRQGSLFPSKHPGVAIAMREHTFLPANVRRIYTPLAPLAGRGRALKLVRGDVAFLIMSLYLPPSPSDLRDKQLSEKIWKWGRRVLDETLDETPSRVMLVLLLDANGRISQTAWPEQIGKYSSKKATFNGQCLGELSRSSLAGGGEHILSCGSDFLWTLLQHSDRLCVSSSNCSCSRMLCTAPRRRQTATGSSVEEGSSLHSVCLSVSAYIRNARKKEKSPMGQEQAYT